MAERDTQNRILQLIRQKLGFAYLGDLRAKDNKNIDESALKTYLKRSGYKDRLINGAMRDLISAASKNADLYETNKELYTLLRYGHSIVVETGKHSEHIYFIDWKNPLNNDFAVAEEVTVKGKSERRPDIVFYINGIAIATLELKSGATSVSKGIRQTISAQTEAYIRPFFNTVQICLAGNDTEGLRYGAIETPEKHYMKWKEDDKAPDLISAKIRALREGEKREIDKDIISLFAKERLCDILYNFIVFDAGKKKLCRQNQFFGVVAARDRLLRREGGIIWHTQGSGKSLTMVWLSRIIKENNPKARILIVTDREELDHQIATKVYNNDATGDRIYNTKSGADLIEQLQKTEHNTMCSLIHKFGVRANSDDEKLSEKLYEKYIEDLKASLPTGFKAKGDFYVFVDECHRTQSGKLHAAMKTLLPEAIFIGFTGTPLLAKQKRPSAIGEKSSVEIFGGYIHTYKYNEATADGVVLDLRYEARDIEQWLSSSEKIDQWFDMKTSGLTDVAKAQLKQRWGTLQNVFSSASRLSKVVSDIVFDMERYPRLKSGHGNALLVAGSIYEACKYFEMFQNTELKDKCAIITSYNTSDPNIKLSDTGEGETEDLFKNKIYKDMLKGRSQTDFENEAKEQFINEPAKMKLLIVVDKLLTGFDAPRATYLYIDKSMRDHGLFQAICRVNRLDTKNEDKDYGYIIDYKDLFKALTQAVADYTSGAFGEFDRDDVQGLLKNRRDEAKKRFEEAMESLRAHCDSVPPPKDTLEFMHYFCSANGDPNEIKANEPKRLTLYRLTSAALRAYADIANDMSSLGYSKEAREDLRKEVYYYKTRRDEIKIASCDYIDLKQFEPDMRHLLDTYIAANESKELAAFDDLTLIEIMIAKGADFVGDLPAGIRENNSAVAETVEANIRKKIVEKELANPKYYQEMSELLDDLIKRRKAEQIKYAAYLEECVALAKKVNSGGETDRYPDKIKHSDAMKALYDNITKDIDFIVSLHKAIKQRKDHEWLGEPSKERKVKQIIHEFAKDDEMIEKIFEIVKAQKEYLK
ncbi:MAG: HsdR family type I site-specific deoxyribonuclease [Helicobacteraceae bacterium]|jgi:type I restriction enzyme R subunit|nr:HsdR family type I site-specific deoxyribonuclease [Helicobacteraceae bacterium]